MLLVVRVLLGAVEEHEEYFEEDPVVTRDEPLAPFYKKTAIVCVAIIACMKNRCWSPVLLCITQGRPADQMFDRLWRLTAAPTLPTGKVPRPGDLLGVVDLHSQQKILQSEVGLAVPTKAKKTDLLLDVLCLLHSAFFYIAGTVTCLREFVDAVGVHVV